jgi:predicted metal-dependent peptidase
MIDGLLVRAAEKTRARDWGTIPGSIQGAIDKARKRNRPQVDWKRVLRIFSAGTGRTRLVTTSRRESPRYGRSTLPGQPPDPRTPSAQRLVPGTKIKRLNSLLVAVDTSASITPPELGAFFDEIHGIWRIGTQVTVVTCDASVHDSFLYKGFAPDRIGGRGGTAFDPVFTWMRAQPERRFDGVVYLTDGFGPAPVTRPPCALLWVVTSVEGMGEHLRFGRQIHLQGARGT